MRLDNFINKCNILCDSQYGFRSNRSTSQAIIDLIENISGMLDQRISTIGIFIDLKKAFDTINHEILLKKFDFYGIRGIVNDWLCRYLSNRKQFVMLDNTESSQLNVICGVPQGSSLGPKLFILYINDIVQVSDILKLIIFADDTNAFCSGDNVIEVTKIVSSELNKLKVWFVINKLSLNVSKTNYMLFSNSKLPEKLNISIKNHCIDKVGVTKFLGVLIDEKLNWKQHINMVRSKLSKTISVIARSKKILNKDSVIYCTVLWFYRILIIVLKFGEICVSLM